MPRKYVSTSGGSHTLADGSPLGAHAEVSLSQQQEKDNANLIEGEVLIQKTEADEETLEAVKEESNDE